MFEAAEGNREIIQRIHNFFHNNVFVHENLYLYFKRMKIRHFEVSHSSTHEVFNLKLHSIDFNYSSSAHLIVLLWLIREPILD